MAYWDRAGSEVHTAQTRRRRFLLGGDGLMVEDDGGVADSSAGAAASGSSSPPPPAPPPDMPLPKWPRGRLQAPLTVNKPRHKIDGPKIQL